MRQLLACLLATALVSPAQIYLGLVTGASPNSVYVALQGAKCDGATDDTTAIQSSIDIAFGTAASPHGTANAKLNKQLVFPQGDCHISAALVLTSVMGGHIFGNGRFATTITQTTINTSVFRTNGFSYGVIAGMQLSTPSNTGPQFDLDWDNTGPVSLQSNTFSDMYFEGGSHTAYGLRIGHSGFMGSENLIQNSAFANFTTAAWTTENYNAKSNTMIGGNIQNCRPYGIYVAFGSIALTGVGFQNGVLTQINATGADVRFDNSANDISTITGMRTESAVPIVAKNSHRVSASGIYTEPSVATWTTGTAYALNDVLTGTPASGDGKLYKTTVAGTTSGGEPTWNAGTVTSGTATFVYVAYTAVEGSYIDLRGSTILYGQVDAVSFPGTAIGNFFSRTDWLKNGSLASVASNVVGLGGGPNTATITTMAAPTWPTK